VTTRNDDHGGNLHKRTQIFICALLEQCRRADLPAELIVVEWNPPSDRPPLKEAYHWPTQNSPCQVRIIQVPAEIHQRYEYASGLPLFQMIAKNVGIRRSRAPYILATNIDLIFSTELMQFLARKELRDEWMYRIDRYDISPDIPLEASLDEQLTFCAENVVRINTRNGSYNTQTRIFSKIYRKEHYELMHTTHAPIRIPLSSNACGDFTLLAKPAWFKLRGYWEKAIFSFHIDSIFCYSAVAGGLKEHILKDPLRIYHIEHGGGFTPETVKSMDQELQQKKVPRFSNEDLNRIVQKLMSNKMSYIFNDIQWGLEEFDLPEETL
jgi:hypothetical protein